MPSLLQPGFSLLFLVVVTDGQGVDPPLLSPDGGPRARFFSPLLSLEGAHAKFPKPCWIYWQDSSTKRYGARICALLRLCPDRTDWLSMPLSSWRFTWKSNRNRSNWKWVTRNTFCVLLSGWDVLHSVKERQQRLCLSHQGGGTVHKQWLTQQSVGQPGGADMIAATESLWKQTWVEVAEPKSAV